MQRGLRVILSVCFLLVPVKTLAETCAAALALARIHDAYLALDDTRRQTREQAAIALLALYLPDIDLARLNALLTHMNPPHDTARLKRILQDVTSAARGISTGMRARLPSDHASDIDWLADVVIETGCTEAWTNDKPSTPPVHPLGLTLRNPVDNPRDFLLYAAFAASATLIVVAIRRTRRFRTQRLRREPRRAVAIAATVTVEGRPPQKTKILDLAHDGMKISLREAPQPGAWVALDIKDLTFRASIVWRNDFYAGLLLDSPLSDAAVGDLLAWNASRAGGRPARASR